jgi:hypothetical protein
METNNILSKDYKTKNFVDKIKYLFEQIKLNFNTLQNKIDEQRKAFDLNYKNYQDLIQEKKNIIVPDKKSFDKEYKMQKNMIQNDLIYSVNCRDIVFLEFYQDIFSIFENLINLEMGISPEKLVLGYNNYKNYKLKDVRDSIDLNNQSFEELEKLKIIVLECIKDIEISIDNHKNYLHDLQTKNPQGLDIKTYCISMNTLIKKIELELDSNKKQFIYQMEDDLVKIYSINNKISFIIELTSECDKKS